MVHSFIIFLKFALKKGNIQWKKRLNPIFAFLLYTCVHLSTDVPFYVGLLYHACFSIHQSVWCINAGHSARQQICVRDEGSGRVHRVCTSNRRSFRGHHITPPITGVYFLCLHVPNMLRVHDNTCTCNCL